MCSRLSLKKPVSDLLELFPGLETDGTDHWLPQEEFRPTDDILVITGEEKIIPMRWGLIPHWAKAINYPKRPLINARIETVHQKASFADPFFQRRCLIPVDGFYEFGKAKESGRKKKHLFTTSHEELFFLAGLWDLWKNPETGNDSLSCTIITTEANEVVSPIHDRMPVIVSRENCREWLYGQFLKGEEILLLTESFRLLPDR